MALNMLSNSKAAITNSSFCTSHVPHAAVRLGLSMALTMLINSTVAVMNSCSQILLMALPRLLWSC